MIKVGLTGNVKSGMHDVGDIFMGMGIPVFDADLALKFLINYREDIIRNIKIRFGSDIYKNNLLSESKFDTTEKFDLLLDIVELELLKLYESWRLVNKDSSYTILKSSILFERKLDKHVNYTISTFKPKDDRAHELSKSDGIGLITAYNIIDSEVDELEKNQRSSWIIHCYDLLSLISQVSEIHNKIEKKSIKSILEKTDFSYNKKIIDTDLYELPNIRTDFSNRNMLI